MDLHRKLDLNSYLWTVLIQD